MLDEDNLFRSRFYGHSVQHPAKTRLGSRINLCILSKAIFTVRCLRSAFMAGSASAILFAAVSQQGFYAEWFSSAERKADFLRHTVRDRVCRPPEFTYSMWSEHFGDTYGVPLFSTVTHYGCASKEARERVY